MESNQEEQVIDVLEKIRPYLQRDGGDVEFVRMEENGRVIVRVFGACVGCSAIDSTIKLGVEALLIDEVPGVTEVIVEED
ncbi:MAG: NifU family protein [Erysipelotrichaceae bacterium]